MAEGFNNLAGGFLTGMIGSKNKAREMNLNEEYKKIAMENVKATAKLHEAQIKKADLEGNLLAWAMGGETPGAGMSQPQTQTPTQPFAQFQPAPAPGPAIVPQPQSAAPQDFTQMLASKQMPLGGGMVEISPAGQKSAEFNNPGNLEYRPWQDKYGATMGRDNRFASYPTPEHGLAANVDRIQQIAKSGATIASAINTWSPTFTRPDGSTENPTTKQRIGEISRALNVSPDTPLANVPIGPFMNALIKGESPTKINPAVYGGYADAPIGQTIGMNPVQYAASGQSPAGGGLGTPQQAMQPQAPVQAPQPAARGGLTREKFLEGYMKKNFGVEPDEVKDVRYGDHTLIIDKKKGTPLFMIAGQGKTEMVDTTLPDGSIIKRPVVIPPSPLPGGIPVINMASGGGQGGLMAGPGMQTAPPKFAYEEVSAPGGGKQKIVAPQAQPGAPPIQTEPPGVKIGDVGKVQQIMNADARLKEVNGLVFPDGKLNRTLLFKAAAPAGGIGEGAKLQSKMYQVIDAALRLETGAQATPGEIEVKMKEFWPSSKDTEPVIREKLKDLNEYIGRLRKLQDPTGQIGDMGGVTIQVPKSLSNQKPKTWDELKKGLTGGQ